MIPVVLNIRDKHLPPCIPHLHRVAMDGMADFMGPGGRSFKINIIPPDVAQFEELKGVETIWLVYRPPTEKGIVF